MMITFNKNLYKRDYFKYYNLKKKYLVNNANIFFNVKCKELNITPKYAKSKNKAYNNPGRHANKLYEKARIDNEIKFLYKKKNFLNSQLYNLELQNMQNYQGFWHSLKFNLLEKLSQFIRNKYVALNTKISRLLEQQKNHNKCKPDARHIFHFHDPVKNLSNTEFSPDELCTMEKHFKSNFHTPKQSVILENTIVESEKIIQDNRNSKQNLIRHQVANIVQKHFETKHSTKNNNNNNKLDFRNLLQKIKDNNLTVNKADKGNIITIENKDDQLQKVEQFLDNSNFEKLKSDPTNRFQTEIKNSLKISDKLFNNQDVQQLINPNPKAPILRTSTKIHKLNTPVRPIVNYIPAPAYKVKKYLNKLLKQKLIINNTYNIKNSKHLTQLLSNIRINRNAKIISLDIKDMYSNVPTEETIKIIENQLLLLNSNTDEIKQLISMLKITLKQNYFIYNNINYLQLDGLPMGSPLSSLISEIFLQSIENQFIEQLKQQYNILFYGRYVDDILIIYNNNHDNTNNILTAFNKIHPKLKFTVESEINNEINYLDLTIKRYNNSLQYSIYRKPTTSKLSINSQSIQPSSHKFANFRFLLNRLNNIPLTKKHYKIELDNILEVARYNNYPSYKIHQMNYSIKNKINLRKITTLTSKEQPNKFHTLTYFGELSDKIKHVFSKQNINIAFKVNNRDNFLLKNKNDHGKRYELESGIYKLNCPCGSSYVGKTFRQFKRRIYEHSRAYLFNIPERSAYAAHLLQPDHIAVPFNNTYEILKIINNKHNIDLWEQAEIQKQATKTRLVNEHHINNNNPLFELLKVFKNLFSRQQTLKITIKKTTPNNSPLNQRNFQNTPSTPPPFNPGNLSAAQT